MYIKYKDKFINIPQLQVLIGDKIMIMNKQQPTVIQNNYNIHHLLHECLMNY